MDSLSLQVFTSKLDSLGQQTTFPFNFAIQVKNIISINMMTKHQTS